VGARFTWVVDHSAEDLGITLTASMLDQLTATARRLHDEDLIAFAERYTPPERATRVGRGSRRRASGPAAVADAPVAPVRRSGMWARASGASRGPGLTALWCPAVLSAGRGLAGACVSVLPVTSSVAAPLWPTSQRCSRPTYEHGRAHPVLGTPALGGRKLMGLVSVLAEVA